MPLLRADALLFDNDGVLVDSTTQVDDAWGTWARHWDLDPGEVVPVVHGTPSRQTVARFVPEPHREEALAMIDRIELEQADGVRALPGAAELLASLRPGTWAIVTSGTGPLARARLRAAGLTMPDVVLTADDVTTGKPDPEPYLAAAARLGVDPGAAMVFEDSAAGVESARAARVRHVVGVTTDNPGTDVFVADLSAVSVDGDGDGVTIR